MKDKIGITGHVDHGKTTLSAAITSALTNAENKTKTIQEIVEEEKSLKIVNTYPIWQHSYNGKSGKQNRRERRAKERKTK